jgi:hypothetical protein
VGRFASAFAFLFTFALVLGAAGCGQRFDHLGAAQPPTDRELASQALAALEGAGSAHVVVDAQGGSLSGTNVPLGVHFEGDVSRSAIVGDGEVRFPGGTLGARALVGEHDAYVRFMGVWYRAGSGLADVLAKANGAGGDLVADLMTPDGLGKRFADLFEGDVTEGPDIDGVATWKFDGSLRGETVIRYSEQYGHLKLTDNDRALLRKVAEASRLILVVGRDDHLPRRIELTLDPPKNLKFDSPEIASSAGPFAVKVELSNFGKDVSFSAPKDAKPLEALFEQLFGVMG